MFTKAIEIFHFDDLCFFIDSIGKVIHVYIRSPMKLFLSTNMYRTKLNTFLYRQKKLKKCVEVDKVFLFFRKSNLVISNQTDGYQVHTNCFNEDQYDKICIQRKILRIPNLLT